MKREIVFRKIPEDMFFTKREGEVIDLMIRLQNTEQIAKELHLAVSTVRTYKRRIFYKVRMVERINLRKEANANSSEQ